MQNYNITYNKYNNYNMAETTEYFAQKRLNFHPINFIWKPNEKYNLEADVAIKEAMFEVDEGVVKKYTALRMKELDQNVNTTCFKNKELSYAQALK